MFKKLKNIKLVNNGEPRIEFEVEGEINNGVCVTRKYDVSLCMVPFGGSNAQKVFEEVLEEVYKQAKLEN